MSFELRPSFLQQTDASYYLVDVPAGFNYCTRKDGSEVVLVISILDGVTSPESFSVIYLRPTASNLTITVDYRESCVLLTWGFLARLEFQLRLPLCLPVGLLALLLES